MFDIEKQDERWQELHTLLLNMDIPAMRFSDINWLMRNLHVRNHEHELYPQARDLIVEIKREINKAMRHV